ncbi:MAG: hypothetical protein ACXVJD_17545 [Mucilaginibacter sp.]
MRKLAFLAVATCLMTGLHSCKKDGDKISPLTIEGKWNMVSDSTFTGVGYSNHPVNYTGRAGDYFDFRTNGYLYTKEAGISDTLSYQLISDNKIIIASFGVTLNGVPEVSNITTFDAHHLTIDAPAVLTPGGQFGRKITLRR